MTEKDKNTNRDIAKIPPVFTHVIVKSGLFLFLWDWIGALLPKRRLLLHFCTFGVGLNGFKLDISPVNWGDIKSYSFTSVQ